VLDCDGDVKLPDDRLEIRFTRHGLLLIVSDEKYRHIYVFSVGIADNEQIKPLKTSVFA
jgi:hypothetical protein